MRPQVRMALTVAALAGTAAATSVVALRPARALGAPTGGDQIDPSTHVADKLIADAEQDDNLRRDIRRSAVSKCAWILTLFLTLAYLPVHTATFMTSWGTPPSLTAAIMTVYRAIQGSLSPETALTAVLGALAVCATINVALAVDTNAGGRRRQVASSTWRSSLGAAGVVLAVAAVVIGCTVWANVHTRADFGAASATSLFAVVTVLLASTSQQQANSVDRASGYRRAVNRLKDLDAWDRELIGRGVPLHFREWSMGTHGAKFPWRLFCAGGIRLLVIGFVATSYLGVLALIGVVVALSEHHTPEFSWWMLKVVFGYGFCAMTVVLVISSGSFHRWTAYTSTHPRWQLDVKPRLVRWGYGLLAVFMTAADWVADGVYAAVFSFGVLLVTPTIAWSILWSSRRWPRATIPRLLADPFWELIDWSIQNSRRFHQEQRDKLLRDQIDERQLPGQAPSNPITNYASLGKFTYCGPEPRPRDVTPLFADAYPSRAFEDLRGARTTLHPRPEPAVRFQAADR